MIYYGQSRNNIFVLLTRSCKLLLVANEGTLSGATGGKVRGQTAGDCGGSHADINTIAVQNRFQEYWQRRQFISGGVWEDRGSNIKKIYKNFRAAWKKEPTIKLEHPSCKISTDCWYKQRTDQGHHLGNAPQTSD